MKETSRWFARIAFFLGILPIMWAVIGKGFDLPKPSFWGDTFLLAVWMPALALGVASGVLSTLAKKAKKEIDLAKRTATTKILASARPPALLAVLLACFLCAPALMPVGHESAGSAITWMALTLGGFLAAMDFTQTPEVVVGFDGIRVGKRFVSFEGVTDARLTPRGIELDRLGLIERLAFYRIPTPERTAQRAEIHAQVLDALAHRKQTDGATTYAMARGGRRSSEWREAIARLVAGGGYRTASVPFEDVLGRPDATAEEKIGAALALKASSQPERVRVAARACADPKVRIALERVAEDAAPEQTDEAIEAALSRTEAPR